jgi:hypothetical protein
MNIEIYTPSPGVPAYIVRYIKEMIRLAILQDSRIDNTTVTLMETGYFDSIACVCEVEFTVQGQSFLISKRADSYFEAASDASRDLFIKVKNNTFFNYN